FTKQYAKVRSKKKFKNFAILKPGPPCAEASASCTPNHTIMIVASDSTICRPSESTDGAAVAVRLSHPFLMRIKKSIACLRHVLVVKCPLGARGRLLRLHRIESLLITIAGLEQRLEIVLLNLLANHLLKLLGLEHLICVLLGAQLDQECLVDPLQSRHLGMLSWICGMR